MGANKNQDEGVRPKCRTTSSFVMTEQLIKLVKKCSVYLVNWVIKQRNRTWTTWQDRITKDGYFPVITVGDGEPKKFMIDLAYLSYPPFVELLEAAENEFGFKQQGMLAIPCEATVLQNILLHV
ncbi:hypothetical protein F511_13925 [Dorcoceras hygrometricum]|uniref:Uncharacterized protein n=1 Tax=Dorcoceras hygrometricum TaxID=472368 RepID=A0A2Z7B3C4_9LAMI|nr:hypothetical protein F511_13925 [Dorcoceras hygrometricum]